MPLSADDFQNPIKLEEAIWRLLARGSVDSRHPFKLCSIATVNTVGLPDARTVVLRTCDIAANELSFYTDIRSGKIAHVKNQPEVCLLFWHPKQSLQLRVYGKAFVHHLNEISKEKIATLPPQQTTLYGYSLPPGSIRDHTDIANFQHELVLQNFAWVQVSVHTIDALHLGRNGEHTRVKFDYKNTGLESTTYLQP